MPTRTPSPTRCQSPCLCALSVLVVGCSSPEAKPDWWGYSWTNPVSTELDGGAPGDAVVACPDIPKLFKATCTDAGCHGAAEHPLGNLDLASPDLASRLTDHTSDTANCGGAKLIDSAEPENSLLYTQLFARPDCGLTMPLGKPAFTDQERACVLAWLEQQKPKGEAAGDAGSDLPTLDGGSGTPTDPADLPLGTELARGAFTATASRTGTQVDVGQPGAALDNDLSTRWGTGLPQDGATDFFQVDLQTAQKFSTIELRMGMWDQDHPRAYKVYASNDPTAWGTAVTSGTTPDQKQPVVSISFPVQNARYLRIENTGTDVDNWWSIYELVLKR